MDKQKRLDKICSDIKSIKIQGATNIAKAAITAYSLRPAKSTKIRLLNTRPTEPTLSNTLNFLEKWPKKKVISHFPEAQEKINRYVYKLIKKNCVIYTHCHSTNVVKALIYAKNKGKKFSVINTETRPLYQGRKTASELSKSGVGVTTFVDSAMSEAIEKSDLVLLGSDAILKSGVINKIGSEAIAILAKEYKKPLYIVADSWKFSPKNIKIEERDFHEVWKQAPKNIKIRNPAFELIPKKYIKGVVSEYGNLKYSDFIKKVDKVI